GNMQSIVLSPSIAAAGLVVCQPWIDLAEGCADREGTCAA
ncbi:MAG: hypothetical protein ACI9P3_001144, partial [Bradyrhizobium sp.]